MWAEALATINGHVTDSKLPIAAAGDGCPNVVTTIVCRVNASQHQLAACRVVKVAVQPKREHRLLDELLLNQIDEWWGGLVHSNLREAHALQSTLRMKNWVTGKATTEMCGSMHTGFMAHQNTIKLCEDECHARFHNCFCKLLPLDRIASKVESVLAQISRQRACAIMNGEFSAILLQSFRQDLSTERRCQQHPMAKQMNWAA